MSELTMRRIPVFVAVVILALLCVAIFAGQRPMRRALPSPWQFSTDDIQYDPSGPKFHLPKEIEAQREHQRQIRLERDKLR